VDKFTRIYSTILAAIAATALIWVFYESPGVSRLNALLSEYADLAAYPYRFRVLILENGVATMSTPRSAEFPAYRALALLRPELRNQSPDSPAMLDAQQDMARVQGIARNIVVGSSDVNRVTWELDGNWLRSEGIDPGRLWLQALAHEYWSLNGPPGTSRM
jgi:hypothetical protein